MKADGSITLDLSSISGGDAKMGMLFAALIADAPGRKITLKVSRPDFFVVSGEEGGRKFYERMAKAPGQLAGPVGGSWVPAWSIPPRNRPISIGSASRSPIPSNPSRRRPRLPHRRPPPRRRRSGAGARAVPSRFRGDRISRRAGPGAQRHRSGRLSQSDDRWKAGEIHARRSRRRSQHSLGGFERRPIGQRAEFRRAWPRSCGAQLCRRRAGRPRRAQCDVGLAARAEQKRALRSLLASLSKNARGAPVFDRKGGLVAIIAQSASEPKLVAGVAPTAVHGMIGADQIQRFLSLTPDSAEQARGRCAARRRTNRRGGARQCRCDFLPSMNEARMRGPRVLVFDSGLGGLTVFAQIAKARPDAALIYAADDAAFPYAALGESRTCFPRRIGDGAPRRRPCARSRGDRLQHRLDPRSGSAARALSRASVCRDGAGDQAGGGGFEIAPGQRAGDDRHGGARLHASPRARICRRLRGGAGRFTASCAPGGGLDEGAAGRRRGDRARDRPLLRRKPGSPHRFRRARLHALSLAAGSIGAVLRHGRWIMSIRRPRSRVASMRCLAPPIGRSPHGVASAPAIFTSGAAPGAALQISLAEIRSGRRACRCGGLRIQQGLTREALAAFCEEQIRIISCAPAPASRSVSRTIGRPTI